MVINKNVREENLARKLKGICLNSDIWNMSAMKSDVLIPNNVVIGEILFIYAKQLLFRYKQFIFLCTFVIVSEAWTFNHCWPLEKWHHHVDCLHDIII